MLVKVVILAFLAAIVVALTLGGVFLVKDSSTSRRTVNALSWRVGLQVGLILFLLLAFFMGWIKPHDPRRIDKKKAEAEQQGPAPESQPTTP